MTAARFHLSREQVFDNAGAPLAGAKLFFYTTGTLTPLATYSNANLSTLNANPVVADSNGRFGDIFLQDQTYRVILKDTTEATTYFDTDPVYKDVTFIRSAGLPAVSFPNMLVHNTSDSKKYRRNSTGTGWIDEGPIDSVGNTAGVADVVAGTSTTLFATPDAIGGLWERGTDIASASTITLPVGGGGYFEVTGTTTITGINSQRSGLEVEFRFQGILTLTHNATTFALLGGASITTEAGDIARFRNVSTIGTSGTNWRMVSYMRATGEQLFTPDTSAKTLGYTVVDADRNDFIRFSGLSADVSLNLPAASGRKGFEVTFANLDATYGVTVDPNGAETIDGVATRKTFGSQPITLYCDGTAWHTISGHYMFRSTAQTITSAGNLTLTHGLGSTPSQSWVELRCTSTEFGYAAGDRVSMPTVNADASRSGVSLVHNANDLVVRYGNSAGVFLVVNKTTGALSVATNGNWEAYFYARS